MFAENPDDFLKLAVVFCRIFQFYPARTQCCCRCLTKNLQFILTGYFLAQINKPFFQNTFDAVYRTVDRINLIGCMRFHDHSCDRRIDC